MPLELQKVVKDKKIYPVLLKWSIKSFSDEQVSFVADTSNNETLYKKWVSPASMKQVNLNSKLQLSLDDMAKAKNWSGMTALMQDAKEFVAKAFDKDEMIKFEKSPQYAALLPKPKAVAPKAPVAPPKPPVSKPPAPKPATLHADTVAAIKVMETAMVEGTRFFTGAIATVKAKGAPSDRIEVNRMFESGRLRHDKVHVEFTERLQKDKVFTRASQAAFFKKKDDFSKLWAEYRKLLGK